ncbi:DSBH domain containing protein [Desulfosporosinus sp. I2]|nr:DSBH domain containing protein [Desulfosporosinus sp. I2]
MDGVALLLIRGDVKVDKINLNEKLDLFEEYWSPKIIGEVNESYVKVAKLKGEFLWHTHENEDEMFYVLRGLLIIRFRDKDVIINQGEFLIIPKGIEHMPVAEKEVHVMLIEAKTTLNTGDVRNERTVEILEKI